MMKFIRILLFFGGIAFIIIQPVLGLLNFEQRHNTPEDVFFIKPSDLKTQIEESSKKMTCGKLKVDETCLILQSNVDYPIRFDYHSMECDNCSLIPFKTVPPHQSKEILLEFASFGTTWKISDDNNNSVCNVRDTKFGENSFYHIFVNNSGCSVICDKEPESFPYPILIACGVFLLIWLLVCIGNVIQRYVSSSNLFHRNSLDDLTAAFSSSSTIEEKKQKQPQRLRSLDTVRGISIAIMIFVNYGGGKYSYFHHSRWNGLNLADLVFPWISIVVMIFVNYGGGRYYYFDHSHWNGLTVADLVFPWFIWMMGMALPLSLKSQLRKAVPKGKIFLKIVKRSITLFALGIMLNTLGTDPVDLSELRIPGVLQRFGISYFVVASLHLLYASAEEVSSISYFRDITTYGGEWLVMLSILTTHLLLMFLVHSPECPRGYFGPGGLHDQGLYANCTGGAAGYIDRVLLGPSHLYQKPSPHIIYHTTQPYDPEGILGYLTSIFLVFLGLQAGKIVLMYKETSARVYRWMSWGLLTGLTAGVLCCFSKNGGWIPINKNLWSVSFILATGSMAFILLTLCYLVVDVKQWYSGSPFYHAGMNAIVLFIGHEITTHMFPWSWKVQSTHMNELFIDLWGTALWVLIAIWMHREHVFISV